jgi:hypothetical protein
MDSLIILKLILLSKAAHLIWVLRCERLIQNPDHIHSEEENQVRWTGERLTYESPTEDKLNATKIKRHKRALQIEKETWDPILKQHELTQRPGLTRGRAQAAFLLPWPGPTIAC